MFGFADNASLKNEYKRTTVADSPEPLDLDNLLGFFDPSGWYVSVSDKTPQHKYSLLKDNKFSARTLQEARDFWEKKNKTELFDVD